MLLSWVALLGCANPPGQQARTEPVAAQVTDFKGCADAVVGKPEYLQLAPKLYLEWSAQYPPSYLTSREPPSQYEIDLVAALTAELRACREFAVRRDAANYRSPITVLVDSHPESIKPMSDFVAGRLVWGAFNARLKHAVEQQQKRPAEMTMRAGERPKSGTFDIEQTKSSDRVVDKAQGEAPRARFHIQGAREPSVYCENFKHTKYCGLEQY